MRISLVSSRLHNVHYLFCFVKAYRMLARKVITLKSPVLVIGALGFSEKIRVARPDGGSAPAVPLRLS